MLYQRPIDEQVCVASNMLKTLASEAKNLSDPTIIEDEYGKYMALGGYEIWWRADVPNHFEITVGCITTDSYWEPPNYLANKDLEKCMTYFIDPCVFYILDHNKI